MMSQAENPYKSFPQSYDLLINMHTNLWENQVAEISLRKIRKETQIRENK
jgi:hypothetical protein